MKKSFFTPNLTTGFVSILIGIFIILKIPTEIEKPVLIFGQSTSEIDPELVPLIVSMMLIIFGSYTIIIDRNSLLNNSWPNLTKSILKNVSFTILCLILYSFLFNGIGFVLASALLIFVLSQFMGDVSNYISISLAIIFPLIVFGVFVNIMHVFLPEFPFFEIRVGNYLIM
tara:strand:- start:244 stop:756 length:513 start_codon:yes stop_codon:yes gene_type:complete